MPREEFNAYIQRAKDLGLDLNKLDFDLIDRATYGDQGDIYEAGQYFEAMIEDRDDAEAYLDDDNLFLHFNLPRTGNREQDLTRLQNALSNTKDFGIGPAVPENFPGEDKNFIDPLSLQEKMMSDPDMMEPYK